MGWPKGKPRKLAQTEILDTYAETFQRLAIPSENPGDPLPSPSPVPVSIQFAAVMLEFELPRMTDPAGKAWSQTARFSKASGYEVKLDPSAGLVHITHEKGGAVTVPIGRVKFFEPLATEAVPAVG